VAKLQNLDQASKEVTGLTCHPITIYRKSLIYRLDSFW